MRSRGLIGSYAFRLMINGPTLSPVALLWALWAPSQYGNFFDFQQRLFTDKILDPKDPRAIELYQIIIIHKYLVKWPKLNFVIGAFHIRMTHFTCVIINPSPKWVILMRQSLWSEGPLECGTPYNMCAGYPDMSGINRWMRSLD